MIVDDGVPGMAHTVDSIKHLLATNDKAVGRALVVLTDRQTTDERSTETTKHLNGRGWRPCHARVGQSMAQFFQEHGFITAKQAAYWRKPMACGNPRIAIYARQLLEQSETNAAHKAKTVTPNLDADEREALENTLHTLHADHARALRDKNIVEGGEIQNKIQYVMTLLGQTTIGKSSLIASVKDDERAMMLMEAEQDRLQTIRDEMNKHQARKAMELCSYQG